MAVSKESDRKMTPDWILEAVRPISKNGVIDLDVCTEDSNPTKATYIFTEKTNGKDVSKWKFLQFGELLWCNPPFSTGNVIEWARLIHESSRVYLPEVHHVMLTRADCRTGWYKFLMDYCDAFTQINKSVAFHRLDGSKMTGDFYGYHLVYFGPDTKKFVENTAYLGFAFDRYSAGW